jgi:Zn-dependent oligopeptidase
MNVHVQAVKDTPEMREAVEAVQGERVKLSLRMSQSRPLYEAFQALRDSDTWEGLTGAQKRIVESELRDFVLGGVALDGEVCTDGSHDMGVLCCNVMASYFTDLNSRNRENTQNT